MEIATESSIIAQEGVGNISQEKTSKHIKNNSKMKCGVPHV